HIELKRRIAAEAEREQLQKELINASRQAGMAEIATGVLHNVGNVLNSVNVAACIVGEKIRQSKVPALGKAVAMIQEHQQDLPEFLTRDDKGKQLPGFLGKLADFLAEEQNILLGEVDQLHRSLDHIEGGGKTIGRLRVIYNGGGIPAENLQKIFQHGFTTRSDGHGFGLHSSAITARNMGGALAASSDGAGKGATFTLELPAVTA